MCVFLGDGSISIKVIQGLCALLISFCWSASSQAHELRLVDVVDGTTVNDSSCSWQKSAIGCGSMIKMQRLYPPDTIATDIESYSVRLAEDACPGTSYEASCVSLSPTETQGAIFAVAGEMAEVSGSVFPPFPGPNLRMDFWVRRGQSGNPVFLVDDACRVRLRVAGVVQTTGSVQGFSLKFGSGSGCVAIQSDGAFEDTLLVDPRSVMPPDPGPSLSVTLDYQVGILQSSSPGALDISFTISIDEVILDEYCTRFGRVGTYRNNGEEAVPVVSVNGFPAPVDFPRVWQPGSGALFVQVQGHQANMMDTPYVLYLWGRQPTAATASSLGVELGGPHYLAFPPPFDGMPSPGLRSVWNSIGNPRAGEHAPVNGAPPCLAPCTVFAGEVPQRLIGRNFTLQGIMRDEDAPSKYSVTNAVVIQIR